MMFTPKNLIALPLLHFPQNSIAILQYFNELESYWNIAIYCNNSINCNSLQYRSIKQRSVLEYSDCSLLTDTESVNQHHSILSYLFLKNLSMVSKVNFDSFYK